MTRIPPHLRPRDAASLIIARRGDGPMQVLMGERHPDHVFMPGLFVFPGGRVDPGDGRVRPLSDLSPRVERLLGKRTGKPARARRARALAMAAVRETFEETGLIVGAPATLRTRSAGWRPFCDTGCAPVLAPLEFVYRAVTPPNRTRRFDARFFLVDATHIHNLHDAGRTDNDELLDLRWLTIEDALTRKTAFVTRSVLEEIRDHHAQPGMRPRRPVPFRYRRRGRLVIEPLT